MEGGKTLEIGALGPELIERLTRVRLVALDVDGVLTDGRIRYLGEQELVQFDVKDGLGLVLLRSAGLHIAWITGRGCEATRKRAAELGIEELHMRSGPKAAVLAEVQERLGLSQDETLAMGDDLPDLELAARAGLFAAPADAVPTLRARAELVTGACAGRGAVRELADLILAVRQAAGRPLDGASG